MKKERIYAILFVGLTLAIALASVRMALANPEGAEVGVLNSTRGNLSGGSIGSVYAQAGNISELEINGTQITKAWQGFYGNVTGNITLEDSNGQQLYKWGIGSTQGEVYAARVNTVNFNWVNCSNASKILEEEVAMGMEETDADNISATFSTANPHPQFYVGNANITEADTCYTTYTYVSGAAQSAPYVYAEVILNDINHDIVYVSVINDTATGFDGEAHDFQMLVPEDGHTLAEENTLTQYYFWVELG
ncbi:MAG: hypothetical protein ABIJ21_03830 [Nanoarchaeota archaeon]